MRIASLSPVLYGFGMDSSDAFSDLITQVCNTRTPHNTISAVPLVFSIFPLLAPSWRSQNHRLPIPTHVSQKIEGMIHHEAFAMPSSSVLDGTPSEALVDTHTSSSSPSYEVHGDGGTASVSFPQVCLQSVRFHLRTSTTRDHSGLFVSSKVSWSV
jgi:hypothetical protein